MSHALVAVILPRGTKRQDVEREVGRLMRPYDENGEWGREGSKWDWYQIGGRWTGTFSGYDPEKDPENIENCSTCGGTGKRKDMDVADGCNGCSGKGTRLAWPTEWKRHDGDILRVRDMKNGDTHAILTPDGTWSEKGRLGWWGIVDTDPSKLIAWPEIVKRIFDAHMDHLVVAVDYHV